MKFKTISFKNGKLKLIDQNALPSKLKYITCKDERRVEKAIKDMTVRGAPLIGVTAAFGAALAAIRAGNKDKKSFFKKVYEAINILSVSRPTAVNIFWALERMKRVLDAAGDNDIASIRKSLIREADKILKEDEAVCLELSKNGAALIADGDSILTHCNSGALATAGIGTALGIIYYAGRQGKKLKIYADETRPRLQGARLTSWELKREGLEPVLICDSAAASLMRQKKIDKILVGADRIAQNGDTANKIGTYSLAVLAKAHKIPFYVAAPVSTIDFKIKTGSQIPIEERAAEEVICFDGKYSAPRNIRVYNPAFDVTQSEFITAIITEKGIVKPPFIEGIKKLKISG